MDTEWVVLRPDPHSAVSWVLGRNDEEPQVPHAARYDPFPKCGNRLLGLLVLGVV